MTATTRTLTTGRRRGILVALSLIAIVAVYAVSVALYALGGQVTDVDADEPEKWDVKLSVVPQSVDAVRDRVAVRIDVENPGPADNDYGLTETLGVLVSGADGDRMLEFGSSGVPSPVSVELVTDGVVEQWPFDSHTGVTTIIAYRLVDGEPQALRTWVTASGRVPGWSISAHEVDLGMQAEFDGVREDVDAMEITATRSGSTITFGIVLLGLMIVMPVLVLTVAIAVYRGRRRVEASFMSWMGAMLFATIPLRTFLPGSPPIGSWIDFLIVLWVIVGLIGGLAIYVAAWMRWSPAPDAPPEASVGVPLEERVDLGVVDAREGAARQG
ncbi:DUF4436 family protein [Microbacterium sp. BR1]|uniref:DUF4436 family protein n=1 Tax=Microbacterium sp. BR1 TaxID=1070896 RepID=UPI000C2CA03C|nr:DUF4436 family protein [Microbacterium sp. BR1]